MIRLENVTKTFGTGELALSEINLTINAGEFVFFTGPSGSGKTTLFRLLTREVLPTQGHILIDEINITKLSRGKVPRLRRNIGVVFQDLKLLVDRTIIENVLLPLNIAGLNNKIALQKVHDALDQVGILNHKDKFPVQLSGGELQRVAIARAIVFEPKILLADEPTGNLDNTTSWEIVKILQDINRNGTTVLMATHNTEIVKSLGKRVVTLEQGKITSDEPATVREETHEEKKDHEKKHKKEETE